MCQHGDNSVDNLWGIPLPWCSPQDCPLYALSLFHDLGDRWPASGVLLRHHTRMRELSDVERLLCSGLLHVFHIGLCESYLTIRPARNDDVQVLLRLHNNLT